MIDLETERRELVRHDVDGARCIPRTELVAGIGREIRRTAGRCGAVDRGKEHEVAARIGDRSAAECYTDAIGGEPQTVVKHEAREVLRWSRRGAVHAADSSASF